jgi:hypothetical protein
MQLKMINFLAIKQLPWTYLQLKQINSFATKNNQVTCKSSEKLGYLFTIEKEHSSFVLLENKRVNNMQKSIFGEA